MRRKGYIFDLDGVLTDTAIYHYKAWKFIADQLGISFTEIENEQLKGVSRQDSLERILSLGKVVISEKEKQKWMQKKNDRYLEYIEALTPAHLLPGVKNYLAALKKLERQVILGSASCNARPILKKLGIELFFDVIIDGTHVERTKPDPQVFLLGAQGAELEPNQCIVFEDSEAGIQAAKTAGMLAVAVGVAKELERADYRILSFDSKEAYRFM